MKKHARLKKAIGSKKKTLANGQGATKHKPQHTRNSARHRRAFGDLR